MGCDPCGVGLGSGDALLAGFPIALVKLKADEIAPSVDAGHGGGATAHAIVEYGVALVGVGFYQPLTQGDWFLRRMFGHIVGVAKQGTVPIGDCDNCTRITIPIVNVSIFLILFLGYFPDKIP